MKPKPFASLNHLTVPVVRIVPAPCVLEVIGVRHAARPTTVRVVGAPTLGRLPRRVAPGTATNEKGAGANASPILITLRTGRASAPVSGTSYRPGPPAATPDPRRAPRRWCASGRRDVG